MFITFLYSKVESKSPEELPLFQSEGDSDKSGWESDSQSVRQLRKFIFLPLVLLGLYFLDVERPDAAGGSDAVSVFLALTGLNVIISFIII